MFSSGNIERVVQTVGARFGRRFRAAVLRPLRPRFACDDPTEVYGVNKRVENNVRQGVDEIILCGDGLRVDRHTTLRKSCTSRVASRSDAKCLQERRGRAKHDEGTLALTHGCRCPASHGHVRPDLGRNCGLQCGVPKKECHPASYHL
jgi:hypothetical protein